MITIAPCQDKKSLQVFENVPELVYGAEPFFVPPYPGSVSKLFEPTSPFATRHGRMYPFLAYRDGKPVGRIAAIVNNTHNKHYGDRVGFFGYFDFIDDVEVALALLGTAEKILKEQGMEFMRGPFNPSINDEIGVLVDGFEDLPYAMMTYNPRYYPVIYEKIGLKALRDVHAYYCPAIKDTPERIRKIVERVKRTTGIKVRSVDMSRLKDELRVINRLFNEAWKDNWGFIPMTFDELELIADELKEIADPDMVLIAEKEGEAIGFSLAVPNINEFMWSARSVRGWLRKLKFIWLLKTRRPKNLRLILLGVDPKFRNKGLGAVFYYESIVRAERKKYTGGELSWILEDNHEIIHGIESMGGKRYKSYRIYENAVARAR